MTILITGGTGFIGLALAEALIAKEEKVRLFAPAGLPQAFSGAPELKGGDIVLGDIRNPADIEAAFADGSISSVAHLAAVTPDRDRELEAPGLVSDVNICGTVNLLRAMHEAAPAARLLLVSSVAVYGASRPAGGAFREDTAAPDPQSLYGITKRASEEIATYLASIYELEMIITRLGPVFGPWEHPSGMRSLLSPHGQIIELAARGQEAVLPRAMAADWLYSRDAGAGLAALMQHPRPRHRLYNLSGGRVTNVATWCTLASQWVDGLKWRFSNGGAHNVNLTISEDRSPLDVERLRSEVGFVPAFTLESAVEDHHHWLAAYQRNTSY